MFAAIVMQYRTSLPELALSEAEFAVCLSVRLVMRPPDCAISPVLNERIRASVQARIIAGPVL